MNGVTNSVLQVLTQLRGRGHDAVVIAPDTPRGQPAAATTVLGFPVIRVPAVNVPKISSLPVGVPHPRLYRALRDYQPDVVHLASPFVLGAAGAAAAKRLGVPAVAIYQTDVAGFAASYGLGPAARAAWWATRILHGACNRTLAPSTAAIGELAAHGVPRLHRWGRGVDGARFHPDRRDRGVRADWIAVGRASGRNGGVGAAVTGGSRAGAPDPLLVGFVGRLAPEKHVERLAVLAGRPDIQLVIVGTGPERGKLECLLPGAVFTGQLDGDELGAAYASLDVFVHTGEHETFCQAVQEALAAGVPAIGPDAGGPIDLIAPGRTGYLLPVGEFTAQLPAAIEELQNHELRERMGVAARASVAPNTWAALVEQLLGHYRDAIAEHGGAVGTEAESEPPQLRRA